MNRKQAKALGTTAYGKWVEGYNWSKETSIDGLLSRENYKDLVRWQEQFANACEGIESKAYIYGISAYFRNVLKKGRYAR